MPRWTPWYSRKDKPSREGSYKVRLISQKVVTATWNGRSWISKSGTRIRQTDIDAWRGLTAAAYRATKLTMRPDAVSAFPEHRVPTDTVFDRLVAELGPALL
jgi:hypothetical protein